MPINQLSTTNTFAQWLTATQALINQSNFYEVRTNLVFDTANTVSNNANTVANSRVIVLNTANNVSNTANLVYSTANNVYNTNNAVTSTATIIFNYVAFAFNHANGAFITANAAFLHANSGFGRANGGFLHANSSFDRANGAFLHANNSFVQANGAFLHANNAFNRANGSFNHANGSFITANAAFNTANLANTLANQVEQNVFSIIDDISSSNTYYPALLLENTGVPNKVYSSSTKLYYSVDTGQLSATNFNSLSDKRKKNNIITLENALDSVMNLRGVSFTWIDNQEKSIGVIAQEIEEYLPEVVSTNSQGEKSVSYGNMVGLLIQAIKELKTEVDNLKKIINTLK